MALPDSILAYAENAPAPDPVPPRAVPLPQAALGLLPQLHTESRLALRRARFLARVVPAASTLLAMAALAAIAGGGALAPTFAWSLLVLCGIGAILASHLRTTTVFRDMAGSAADLRAILLYLGFAWGAGAFLALTPQPVLILAFAVAPTLALALMLGDGPGLLAFAAPVTLLAATACLLDAASPAGAAAILALQASLGGWLYQRLRAGIVPPGLAVR